MKLAILHLSDFHFKKENSGWIIDRAHQVANAVKLSFADCKKIYIVVSGDIANVGQPSEYELAKTFFTRLRSGLTNNYNGEIPVDKRILCVPGNHDVFLKEDNKVRMVLLKSVQDSYPEIDGSIFENIVQTQDAYTKFVREINDDPTYKPSLQHIINDKIDGFKIRFNLYNTAWMFSLSDPLGSIYMPMSGMKNEIGKHSQNEADLVVSVMHHYYNWLASAKQNKTDFMRRIAGTSNILIYGHEHEFVSTGKFDNFLNRFISEYEGSAFYSKDENGTEQSRFEVLVIDTEQSTCQQTTFRYDSKDLIYRSIFSKSHNISTECKTGVFRSNGEYLQSLNDMPTPIYNHENEKLNLTEIYIYPDLESMSDRIKTDIDAKYLSAEQLLSDADHSLFILEGGNQCGKTSLCNMYYMKLANAHNYPLMLNGKDINNENLKRILRNAYQCQYLPEFADYEKYEQYDKIAKVLLIDNFDRCKLGREAKEKMIRELLLQFGKIIVTIREDKFIVDSLNYFRKESSVLYHIKSFGYEKRAELVEKFYERYENVQNISPQEMLNKTNEALRMVQQFLGKEYIPPYPIYILSLLLSSAKMIGQTYAQTAYGHCYDAIITCALLTQVKNDDVSQFRNFLKNSAFYMFVNKIDCFSDEKFRSYYEEYKAKYIITSYENCKNVLLNSGLLVCEDDCYYRFGYKYVYYFTVAEYISGIINQDKGKSIIRELCDEIESEDAANILIFLTYHIDDESFIDETIFTLMSSIEDVNPITLKKEDGFYSSIERLCDELRKETIDVFKKSDPKSVRRELMRSQDDIERQEENIEAEERQNERFKKIDKAMRAIDVVGQIIKNRRNTLEKNKLKEMLIELYYAGFRTINYLGETLIDDKRLLVEDIIKDEELNGDTLKIRERINYFFEIITFRFCLFVFSKIISSVGVKELRWLYKEVSEQIATPAAEIVTFSIESVYSKLAVEDLKCLVNKYKDNSPVMTIIRARVRSYLYNNYVEIGDRQRIGKTLRLDMGNTRIANNTIGIRKK